MARHREQVRQGFLTRGLHRSAFLEEWGTPTRTFTREASEPVFRTNGFTSSWQRPIYEIWEYPDRSTCLTFDGVRLIAWRTGTTDCQPKPSPEPPARQDPPPAPPFPPLP